LTERTEQILATLDRPTWLTDEVLEIYERGCPPEVTAREWEDSLRQVAVLDAPFIPSFVAVWASCGFKVCEGREREAKVLFAADTAASGRRWTFDEATGLYGKSGVSEQTVRTAGPTPEEIAAHVLVPGDCVWILDARDPDPQSAPPIGRGVVARSQYNTAEELEVCCGGEMLLQAFPVKQLRWMGKV